MLNGVIFEPGYGARKQGKERVFVTTDEMASHSHDLITNLTGGKVTLDGRWKASIATVSGNTVDNEGGTGYITAATVKEGKNQAHNNIQPAVASYCWLRTA